MTAENPEKLLMSLSNLSYELGLGRTALYKLLNSEQLPKAIFLNGRRYWLRKEILIWLESLKKKDGKQ